MKYSIKYLLIAVSICCVFALIASSWINDPQSRIQRLGVSIESTKLGTCIHAEHLGDEALEELVTQINRLDRVDALFLSGKTLTDNGFSKLANLAGVTRLSLKGMSISSKSLKHIATINGLKYVHFTDCPHISPTDIKSLRETNEDLAVSSMTIRFK